VASFWNTGREKRLFFQAQPVSMLHAVARPDPSMPEAFGQNPKLHATALSVILDKDIALRMIGA
jgi:hypothetical protein